MYRSSATPILSATILKSNTHGLCVAPKLLVFPWTVVVRQRLYAETTVPSPFRLTTKPSLRIVHATKSYCLVLSANCAGPSDALMESKTTLFVRPLSQKPKRRGQISPCRRVRAASLSVQPQTGSYKKRPAARIRVVYGDLICVIVDNFCFCMCAVHEYIFYSSTTTIVSHQFSHVNDPG